MVFIFEVGYPVRVKTANDYFLVGERMLAVNPPAVRLCNR